MKNFFFTLLVSLNLISCTPTKCSVKPPTENVGFRRPSGPDTEMLQSIDSFVKIDIYAKKGQKAIRFAGASGFFVSKDFVVTAKHACDVSDDLEGMFGDDEEVTVSFSGQTVKGEFFAILPVKVHPVYDLCLMQTFGAPDDARPMPISVAPPTIGEKVFNVAAPLGMFTPGMVPMFEGRYFGDTFCESEVVKCSIYGIPIKKGSSGSPVVNKNGYLIGVIYAGVMNFENVGFSVTHKQLIDFLINDEGVLVISETKTEEEPEEDAGVSYNDAGE